MCPSSKLGGAFSREIIIPVPAGSRIPVWFRGWFPVSFQLMAWASGQTTGSPSRKAVLVALANRANHDTGLCCPSVETIAAETEMSERTVRRALAELVDGGYVSRRRRRRQDGTLGVYEYEFSHVEPPVTVTSPPATVAASPPVTVAARNQEQPSNQDYPPIGPPHEHDDDDDDRDVVVANGTTVAVADGRSSWTVDRRKVLDDERDLAERILTAWNTETGQRLQSRDWLSKIVMRCREHPTVTLEDHVRVIRAALSDPWWTGPPSPSVVYGNGAMFERCIEHSRAPTITKPVVPGRYGRGLTTAQIGEMFGGHDYVSPLKGLSS